MGVNRAGGGPQHRLDGLELAEGAWGQARDTLRWRLSGVGGMVVGLA